MSFLFYSFSALFNFYSPWYFPVLEVNSSDKKK